MIKKKIKLLVHTPMVPYTITLASKPTGCIHKKDLHLFSHLVPRPVQLFMLVC